MTLTLTSPDRRLLRGFLRRLGIDAWPTGRYVGGEATFIATVPITVDTSIVAPQGVTVSVL